MLVARRSAPVLPNPKHGIQLRKNPEPANRGSLIANSLLQERESGSVRMGKTDQIGHGVAGGPIDDIQGPTRPADDLNEKDLKVRQA